MSEPKHIPRWPPFTFGGMENPPYDEARAVVVPVPFDSTASYRSGAREGPESIIDASRHMELFDHDEGWSPCAIGIHTMRGIDPSRGSVEETLGRVRQVVSGVLSGGKLPILLGGEHSITIGAVRAASEVWEDLGVLVLDAHCDMRDEYEGSKYSHACTSRRLSEIVPDVWVAGARSCSEEEWQFINESDLKVGFWKEGDGTAGLRNAAAIVEEVSSLGTRPLYLSIDLDVLNPSELPAVGTPEPSGPTYDDILSLIRTVVRRGNLVGLDLVELTPVANDVRSQFLAAKLAYKIIGYRFENERDEK
jgi:agmatinase